MSETLTMANPIEPGKIRTHHAKIVVECTTGKPYYRIEWFDTAKQEYYLGYSSYCIDNVLGWLKESFEIVEAPKTNADRIRAMSDEELAVWLSEKYAAESIYRAREQGHEPTATQVKALHEGLYTIWMQWLRQPAEVYNGQA